MKDGSIEDIQIQLFEYLIYENTDFVRKE